MKDTDLTALAAEARKRAQGAYTGTWSLKEFEQITDKDVPALADAIDALLARIAALREAMTWKAGMDLAVRLEDALAADDNAQGESSIWVCQTPKNR